jgi:LPPG:FO 2-phospho-L-lactate transferase
VDAGDYEGAEDARPAPGVSEALEDADAVVLAPSNPYLSIGPILAVEEIRAALRGKRERVLAVSPLVGGAAVTGPLGRMLARMSGGTAPSDVARCYDGLIATLVIDEADAPASAEVELVVTPTLMPDEESERRLARTVLEAACA